MNVSLANILSSSIPLRLMSKIAIWFVDKRKFLRSVQSAYNMFHLCMKMFFVCIYTYIIDVCCACICGMKIDMHLACIRNTQWHPVKTGCPIPEVRECLLTGPKTTEEMRKSLRSTDRGEMVEWTRMLASWVKQSTVHFVGIITNRLIRKMVLMMGEPGTGWTDPKPNEHSLVILKTFSATTWGTVMEDVG